MDTIRVAARVRPFNQRERDRNARMVISINGPQTTITNPETEETRTFTFDYSYWSHDDFEEQEDGLLLPVSETYTDQQKVFEDLGSAMITNANKGFNCSVFAYGETGAGKSYVSQPPNSRSRCPAAAAAAAQLLLLPTPPPQLLPCARCSS